MVCDSLFCLLPLTPFFSSSFSRCCPHICLFFLCLFARSMSKKKNEIVMKTHESNSHCTSSVHHTNTHTHTHTLK